MLDALTRRVLAAALSPAGPVPRRRLPEDPEAAVAHLERTRPPPPPGAVEQALALLERTGTQLVVAGTPAYPRRLAEWWPARMPLWLFVEPPDDPALGLDTDAPTLAVVGTRAPSRDGLRTAWRLARHAAEHGVVVVSGLARGIDQAAHRGALAAGAGATIGVRGTGAGVDYPSGSAELRAAVRRSGGLVSPFPPRYGVVRRRQFLDRNVVLAGLADVTVVVEGLARSGAVNTANTAAELGRTVMAVPGSLNQPTAEGPLALIRDGATAVTSYDDVLVQLELERRDLSAPPDRSPAPLEAELGVDAAAVATLLSAVPVGIDELVEGSGLTVGRVLAALTELEQAGVAHAERGGVVR